MLRHLPEGSLYGATLSARNELRRKELEKRQEAGEDIEIPEAPELSELDRLIQEKQTWTLMPSLMAQHLNRQRLHIMSLYKEKDMPEFQTFGPEAWWPEDQKNQTQKPVEGGVKPSLLTAHFAGKTGANG